MTPRLSPTLCLVLALAAGPAMAKDTESGKIKKCQDAQGRWHYGDTAAEACAQSRIIELSETGVKRKVIAAPPTDADLAARAQDQAAKEREAEEAKRDQLLLSTYAHEADISYVRDRKLAQIESSIKASEDTLKSLRAALARVEKQAADESAGGKAPSPSTENALQQTRAQIQRHEAAIAAKRTEQQSVRQQAEADLKRYRELKKAPVAAKP